MFKKKCAERPTARKAPNGGRSTEATIRNNTENLLYLLSYFRCQLLPSVDLYETRSVVATYSPSYREGSEAATGQTPLCSGTNKDAACGYP